MHEIKKHAKELQAKALEMFADPKNGLDKIGLIYQMLEVAEKVLAMQSAEFEKVTDHAKDELMGAEEYLEEYAQTQDKDYLRMAYDELGHAKKFIMAMADGDAKQKYLGWHGTIADRLKGYGVAV